MDTVLRIAGNRMDAISVHAYVHLHSFTDKGSATAFTEEEYYLTMRRAFDMEGVVQSRLNILEKHDPEHRIGLSVDEWGAWFDCEPGTNPGFLYQQSAMRDALCAAVKDGTITLMVANLSCTDAETVDVTLSGVCTEKITVRILTGDMHAKNTFEDKNAVAIQDFSGVEATGSGLRLTLPACSVAEISLWQN